MLCVPCYAVPYCMAQDDLEALYRLADKYDMAVLCALCDEASDALPLGADAAHPGHALRWLAVAERFGWARVYCR